METKNNYVPRISGLELISMERHKQFSKRITIESDVEKNDMGQLKWAAQSLITELVEDFPSDWDLETFKKWDGKQEVEKLVIAGALLVAEIDRLICVRTIGTKNK